MYVFIYLVESGLLIGHLLGNSCSLGKRYSVFVLDCQLFFPPWSLEWGFRSDFAFPEHFLLSLFEVETGLQVGTHLFSRISDDPY